MKLTDAQRIALAYVVEGGVTYTKAIHPVKKPYYTVPGYWQKPRPAAYDFLIREGLAKLEGNPMRPMNVVATEAGRRI